MTPAGLRSLFRYHRQTTGIQLANPHRFRHTFASDMIRAGISLPALMQLMGHADIQTTLRLCAGHSPRRLPSVCARRGAAHSPPSGDFLMNRARRRPPLQHRLAPCLRPRCRFPRRCTQSRDHSSLPRDCPQLPELSRRRSSRGQFAWTNCAVSPTSSAGCLACARKCRRSRLHPISTGSSLCAPSSTNWRGPNSFLNSLI